MTTLLSFSNWQLLSFFSTFLPLGIALFNTFILWQMYSIIIAQNGILIDMISSSKNEIIDKVVTPLPEAVIINSEPDVWSTYAPYLILIGSVSVVIFGAFFYFYFISNSNGVPPTNPSTEIKKLEQKFEEISSEIVEESKDYFIPNESFNKGNEDILKIMSELSDQLQQNSLLISRVNDDQLAVKRAIGSLKLSQAQELGSLTEQVSLMKDGVMSLYRLIGTYFKAS